MLLPVEVLILTRYSYTLAAFVFSVVYVYIAT